MLKNTDKRSSYETRNRKSFVVDAIVVPTPDLNALIRSQNVINFFISCLEDIGKGTSSRSEGAVITVQCIEAMKRVQDIHNLTLPQQIESILSEFIMEAERIKKLLSDETNEALSNPKEFNAFIEAKTYKIRYLSNVLTSEMEALKNNRTTSRH
ncbi:MAG: hypothetical protein GF401_06170 [Chitinivibrionales bacterium]|nr:hypothetical protein [Chitinivibrionales bacterium]